MDNDTVLPVTLLDDTTSDKEGEEDEINLDKTHIVSAAPLEWTSSRKSGRRAHPRAQPQNKQLVESTQAPTDAEPNIIANLKDVLDTSLSGPSSDHSLSPLSSPVSREATPSHDDDLVNLPSPSLADNRDQGENMVDDSDVEDIEPMTPPESPVIAPSPIPSPILNNEWVRYVTEEGDAYYYNSHTQESQWTRPSLFMDDFDVDQAVLRPLSPVQRQQLEHQEKPISSNSRQLSHPSSIYRFTAQSIFEAATADSSQYLVEAIHQGADLNAPDQGGILALHLAVLHNNLQAVAVLLEYGAHVDAVGVNGESSLEIACRLNLTDCVRLLVRYGASIYPRNDNRGETILHIAVRNGSNDVLYYLVENIDGTSSLINLRNIEDETPLHLAARTGNATALSMLVAQGATMDIEDSQGRTPLVASIMENHVECVRLLQQAEVIPLHSSAELISYPKKTEVPVAYEEPPTKVPEYWLPERSDMETTQNYIIELVHQINNDALTASIYQFLDIIQEQNTQYVTKISEVERKNEELAQQLQQLIVQHNSYREQVTKLQDDNVRLNDELTHQTIQRNSFQSAFEGLQSRASMLESIARSAQEKLQRERIEHARQETYWSQTIDASLCENQVLLKSLQTTESSWKHINYSMMANETAIETTQMDAAGYNQYSANAYETGNTNYESQAVSNSHQAQQPYELDDDDEQYEYAESFDTTYYSHDQPSTAHVPTSSRSVPKKPLEVTSRISPERVDAVWNRFFENMSRSAEGNAISISSHQHEPISHTALSTFSSSALFDAVRKSNRDRLRQMLLSGVSPNIRDIGERGTPLHLATELGDLDAVMLLSEFGAELESLDENGNTPLLMACAQGHFECTKFLLQSAANLEAVNSASAGGDTALHLAAWDGSVECVSILVEYGIDVLSKNALGLTALANVRTRSPLRHRLDDLKADHPMAMTLVLLEEAEKNLQDKHGDSTSTTIEKSPPELTKSETSSKTSWGRWILGSVFGSRQKEDQDGSSNEETDEEHRDTSSGSEDEVPEAPSPSRHSWTHLQEYEKLLPPPDVEAELRRHSISGGHFSSLPPPPREVLDAMEKRNPSSPIRTVSRFASPAMIKGSRKASTTPAHIRSRYVDTFNQN